MNVYVGSSNKNSDMIYNGIELAVNKFGFNMKRKSQPGILGLLFKPPKVQSNEIVVDVHITEQLSPVRTLPASSKETISGSKLRACDLYEDYNGNWCVGIETGIMKSGNYYDPTETVTTTTSDEFSTNSRAKEFMDKCNCTTEKQHQMALNAECRERIMNLGISDLSSSDTYGITAVTVISPDRLSITFLSEAIPLPCYDREMELHKFLHNEMRSEGNSDLVHSMSNGMSSTNNSIEVILSHAFGKLLKFKQSSFTNVFKNYWTDDRKNRTKEKLQILYPYPHQEQEPFPNCEIMTPEDIRKNISMKYWMCL